MTKAIPFTLSLAAFSLAFAVSLRAQDAPAGDSGAQEIEKPVEATGPATQISPVSAQGMLNRPYLLGDFNGARTKLEDMGFVLGAIYTGETFGNPIGGAKQGAIYEGMLELDLTLDLKKMGGWNGAFHASSYYPMGTGLTEQDTHDLLMVSNIDAYNTLHLFELWYEQKAFDDKVALRVGQMGANQEFFISNAAANFLAGTYGWPGILASNAPTPNYAYAAPGVRLRVEPEEHWSFLASVFAGNPAPDRLGDPNPNRAPDREFNNSGAGFYINPSQGVFSINELWYKLNQEKDAKGFPGTYKVGGWFHADTFSSKLFDKNGVPISSSASDGQPQAVDGNYGFYVVADQAVWQNKADPKAPKEIDLFFRAGNAQADRSVFDYYCDGGITFTGFIPGRPSDLFGAATAYGNIGDGLLGYVEGEGSFSGPTHPPADFEQNIELTYLTKITPWCSVQPDLQIIIHPGGSAAIHLDRSYADRGLSDGRATKLTFKMGVLNILKTPRKGSAPGVLESFVGGRCTV